MAEGRILNITGLPLPPTENHIRVHRSQGGVVYSKKANLYRKQFLDIIRTSNFAEVNRFVSGHVPDKSVYRLEMEFTFETVINKGWAKNKAKTLYKRFDVGNRRKLLEDCLVESLGEIDDCLFFEVYLIKRMGDPEVCLTLTEVNPEDYGVPDVKRDGRGK